MLKILLMAGDAGHLVRLGSPPWPLVMFGVVATALGLFLWHRRESRVGTAGRIPEKREGPAPS